MLPLGANEIHIHLLQTGPASRADLWILSAAERERVASFKFDKDRELYAAAHVFLRRLLSRYGTLPPESWQFSKNLYGKPAVANQGYGWLQFNLSHTHGRVACALTRERQVGVDIERQKTISDFPALCRHAFSEAEAEHVLSARHRHEQEQRFFNFWTLKEAYIKARGMGLSLPLQQFSFHPGHEQAWQLHYAPEFQDNGENWQFGSLALDEQYYLAYCVQAERRPVTVRFMEADTV